MASSYSVSTLERAASISTVGSTSRTPRAVASRLRLRAPNLHEFYSCRSHRAEFTLCAIALCYGGGGAMFWLHAIYRGEAGPPIAAPYHWFLDSTLGLVALAPVIFVVLPVTVRWLGRQRSRLQPLAVGALFALFTTPGPSLHDRLVGHGTPLARLATTVFGQDPGVAAANLHAASHSALSECLLQLAVGLPVYVALAYAATLLSRVTLRRTSAPAAGNVRHMHPEPAVADSAAMTGAVAA